MNTPTTLAGLAGCDFLVSVLFLFDERALNTLDMPITCQHNNKNDTTTHVLWRKSVSEPCSFCPSCLLQHKVSHGDNDHITYFLQLLLDLQCCPVMKVIPHRSHQSLSVDDSSCLSFYKRHEEEYQALINTCRHSPDLRESDPSLSFFALFFRKKPRFFLPKKPLCPSSAARSSLARSDLDATRSNDANQERGCQRVSVVQAVSSHTNLQTTPETSATTLHVLCACQSTVSCPPPTMAHRARSTFHRSSHYGSSLTAPYRWCP